MEDNVRQLVQAIHDSPYRTMLVAAGAGTQALSDLLGVAGASRTLLEAIIPYSTPAFDEFLGQTPDQYVSPATVRLLAGRAFTRARWLEAENDHNPVIGLACTATIVTDRPKRGEHRAYIATWQKERLVWSALHIQKGVRDRAGEEGLVSRVMLNSLAQAANVPYQLEIPLLPGDQLIKETRDFAGVTHQLHRREINCFCVEDNGRIQTTNITPRAILSGAFNPLHDGHLKMVKAARAILGTAVAFELAAVNADKPSLPTGDILERISQFAGRWPILVSSAPTFIEKARLYPGATFIVGYDTAERILHPRYYQNNHENMLAALTEIRHLGCRFLVAGRVDNTNTFRHLTDLAIPSQFRDIFLGIPDTQFRKDISSTELRRIGKRGSR
ncbi:MAG: hypothetical protein H6667_05935 [Ardenticatenaceae bacterium]|nr:hypothetical protein [Ardenticatenaceae bacterium]MCB9443731.1 hypothetical protein [Ardenticatenaceae bacterium]